MKRDLFAHKSKSWDMNSNRVKNAEAIAKTIVNNIPLDKNMHLLDVGAGTGLLSFFVAQKVGKITAVDTSPSMLAMFEEKQEEFDCKTDYIHADIATDNFEQTYDGIISSMTIHHIQDTKHLLEKLYTMLKNDGFIALADLKSEDGTFHSDNTGVFHYGFDTQMILNSAEKVGFKDVVIHKASTIKKPHKDFEIFLLVGRK